MYINLRKKTPEEESGIEKKKWTVKILTGH
jgi:hypothetical protein